MKKPNVKARVFAFYLPQFHPIPENDKWWGKGFTEWTNVGKAKKLFPGHYQPHIPADLGYYDLRVEETREAQAEMAKKYGIEGFIYWHYWFGNGKRLLERPINEVLKLGKPDFPFAFAWANETWKGFAHGLKNRNILINQTYPGKDDYIAHFYEVLPAFKDKRYIKVDGKPLFVIYKPEELPDIKLFIELWQDLAVENGLNGIYFVAHHKNIKSQDEEKKVINEYLLKGFDSINFVRLSNYNNSLWFKLYKSILHKIFRMPAISNYKCNAKYFTNGNDKDIKVIPTVIPNWDHTPRSGKEGLVLVNSTPQNFRNNIRVTLNNVMHKPSEHRIIFIKSWNEWAEGNYLEPDLKWGYRYLEQLADEILVR